MALPDPLTLKNAAAASMTFTRRLPIPNGNKYVHQDATPMWTPYVEVRNLFVTPKKGDKYSRSIVTFGITRVDTDDNPHTGSVSLSVVRPYGPDITDGDLNDLFAMQGEFMVASSGGYLARVRRGEV